MASVTLAVVLAPIAPPFGAIAGGLIGAYIDQALIYPALMGDSKIKGPRLDDLSIQTASEGSPIKYCLGPECRTAGTLIWMSDLIEEVSEEDVGGGKGGDHDSTVTSYLYYTHVAVGVCEGPVHRISKIWADGKLIYKYEPGVTLSSTQISAERFTTFTFVPFPTPGHWEAENVFLQLDSPSGGPDLSQFESGVYVTVSGFGNAISVTSNQLSVAAEMIDGVIRMKIMSPAVVGGAGGGPDLTTFRPGVATTTSAFADGGNNGTFTCIAVGWESDPINGGPQSWVTLANTSAVTAAAGATATVAATASASAGNNGTFMCDSAVTNGDGSTTMLLVNPNAITQAASPSITLTQIGPSFDSSIATDIRIYKGTASQSADSLIQSFEGAADTPAYRHLCYVVFEKLALGEYGNRVPQFSFLVEADSSMTVQTAIGRILERTGAIAGSDYDVSRVSEDLRGFVVSGPQPTNRILEQLILAFDLYVRESRGKLVFLERGDEDTITVSSDDLSAHTYGEDHVPSLRVTDPPGFDLPHEVNVKFAEPKLDYQQGSMRERRINKVTDSVIEIDLSAITMSASQARRIAKRHLWSPWSDRFNGELVLPPSYLRAEETDIIKARNRDTDEEFRVRVIDLSRGNNFIHEIRGVVESTGTFSFNDPDAEDPVDLPQESVYIPRSITGLVLDIPPLTEEDVRTPGYYLAACCSEPGGGGGSGASGAGGNWKGAVVYGSDDGASYAAQTYLPNQATIFRTTEVLGPARAHYWDDVNTVTVQTLGGSGGGVGTLSTKTELEVLRGANRVCIGGEILAFMTSRAIGGGAYELSGLLRGLNGTEDRRYGHAIGEMGVLLPPTGRGVKFVPLAGGKLYTSRFFKFATPGASLSLIAARVRVLGGSTARPIPPTHVFGTRDSANNLTIEWVRRSRAPVRLIGIAGAPMLDDAPLRYEVDILTPGTLGLQNTVKRRIYVHDVETLQYTAVDQAADGFTPGDPKMVSICQSNDLVGRGQTVIAIL